MELFDGKLQIFVERCILLQGIQIWCRVYLIDASLSLLPLRDDWFVAITNLVSNFVTCLFIPTVLVILIFGFRPFCHNLNHGALVLHLILDESVSVKEALDAPCLHKQNDCKDYSEYVPNVAKPKRNFCAK